MIEETSSGAPIPAASAKTLTEVAPAKVNLALHLRRRRGDGYHDLETLFAFTSFGDTLEVQPDEGLSLIVTGPFATAVGDNDNLVLRAARALASAADARTGAALTLDKHIPVAAGLGGGSADAAAALRLLNRFWGLDWPLERLAEIAAPLGADVPACVFSRTIVGKGRGEVLLPAAVEITGIPILLVNPRVAVPTGPVFAAWDKIDRGSLDAAKWRNARNDLAGPAITLAPVIAEVLTALIESNSELARMSGSGATCFALYADNRLRDAAKKNIASHHTQWWMMASMLL